MTTYDKWCDAQPLSDVELIRLMNELASAGSAARRLGKRFALAEAVASMHWVACAHIADARGLKYAPYLEK